MSVLLFRFLSRNIYITFFIAVAAWLLLAAPALAADVALSPASGSYSAGQTFTVTVQAAPNGDSINAVEANLTFDTETLAVVNIAKTGSVFSLWTTEPTFSNSAGTIAFGGGSPTPFTNRSNLVVITFRAKAEGSGTVSFANASALAADGRGTDVLENSPGGTYTVAAAATTPEPPPAPEPAAEEETDNNAAIAFGDPPRAPEIGSTAFLDPDVWYNITEGLFTWELPFDVSAVAVEIATSSDNDPSEVFDPPIEEFAVNDAILSDGVQYLSVQFENQVGWGGITNRRIQVDTTPPEPFEVEVIAGTSVDSFPTITFEAEDPVSGIEYYEMTIADREPIEVTPGEARIGYLLGELVDGTYTVRVKAFDKAGNMTESSAPVLITAGWVEPSEDEESRSIWSFFTGSNIVILVLLLLLVLETLYIWYMQKQHNKKEELLRKETKEIQDQMEKIFSALRDEIYDQINTITKRPRLSKKEKEAVEGLNQALEVSETLIEKEINDVKKVLK